MGFLKKRSGRDGKPRYTAVYVDLRGSERSAGTYSTDKAANKAWQKAEVELQQGRGGDPARDRQRFRRYVEEQWLPNHVLEPTTREKYTSAYLADRTLRCRIPDLGVAFATRITTEGADPVTEAANGAAPAQVRFTAKSDDVVAIAADPGSFARAWLTGRLKVEGNVLDLLRLRKLI